ncbi:MAG: DUF2085 domain-containing protein [Anaerolineales bacterium]
MDGSLQKPEIVHSSQRRKIILAVLVGLLFGIWLFSTPPGLLGKSDALAYAVCHRIGSHSFYIGGRPFSLCSRCSGQYLGFLWGFSVQLVLAKKKSGFPNRWLLILLGGLALFYVIDGLNSLFWSNPGLENWAVYQPSNSLRLFSGLGMGIAVSAVYYPLMGQTIWKEYSLSKSLGGVRDWAIVLGGGALIGFLVLLENPLLSYYLILLSTAGLLTLLTLLYTVIWILITKMENSFQKTGDLGWWMVAGFGSALLQIALIDGVRYLLTGTWSGYLDI